MPRQIRAIGLEEVRNPLASVPPFNMACLVSTRIGLDHGDVSGLRFIIVG